VGKKKKRHKEEMKEDKKKNNNRRNHREKTPEVRSRRVGGGKSPRQRGKSIPDGRGVIG